MVIINDNGYNPSFNGNNFNQGPMGSFPNGYGGFNGNYGCNNNFAFNQRGRG